MVFLHTAQCEVQKYGESNYIAYGEGTYAADNLAGDMDKIKEELSWYKSNLRGPRKQKVVAISSGEAE
jgi:hypothetical protein